MNHSRQHSDPQEEQLRMRFRTVGIDFQVRDRSSGSARQDLDGLSRNYALSCKFRSQKGFSLSRSDVIKDVAQAKAWNRTPLWVLRNERGQDMVMVTLNEFLRIIASCSNPDGA